MNDNKASFVCLFGFLGFFLCIFIVAAIWPPQHPKKEIRIMILRKDCKSLLDIDRDDWITILDNAEELT